MVDTSLRAGRGIETLDRLAAARGLPRSLVVDRGPELVSLALDLWAYRHGVQLNFIDPGKPTQNAYIKNFHSRFRDKCLSAHWFESLPDARFLIERWRQDYNDARPHTSLGASPPPRKPSNFKTENSTIHHSPDSRPNPQTGPELGRTPPRPALGRSTSAAPESPNALERPAAS